MFSLSSLLESRNCVLYLRTILGCQRIQKKVQKLRLDALSIPNYVIKKGRSHGVRHGKTEEQKEYRVSWNAWKRCCKKVGSQGGHFTGIHDRFLRDPVQRESQLALGWTEQKCKDMEAFAKEDHTYHLTPEEQRRYQGQWYLTLNKSGKNGLMKLRCLYQKSSLAKKLKSIFLQNQYRRWHPFQAHRSGTSLNGIGIELIRFFVVIFFLLQLVSFTVDSFSL